MEFYAVMRFKLTPGRLQVAATHLGNEWLRYARSMGGGRLEPKTFDLSFAGLEGRMELVPAGYKVPDAAVSIPTDGAIVPAPVVPAVAAGAAKAEAPSGGVRGPGTDVHSGKGREVRGGGSKAS